MGRTTQLLIFIIILFTGFITTTVFLPIIILHHHHHHHHPPPLDLPSTASQFLQSNGFTYLAHLIHISPDLFLSTPESTIFAIPDSSMHNLSIPPYMTIELITYHISPYKLTMQDLFEKPLNSCFNTMFHQQKLAITKKDEQKHLLEINNVLITKPDMFVDTSVVIHGVSGPFASFKRLPEIYELPICSMNQSQLTNVDFIKIKSEWKMMVRFLNMNGFTPFALWLYNVLDGIVKDHPDLRTMTIFAPPVFEVMEVPGRKVYEFIRAHIVPKKYSFKHLASMPRGGLIGTLCPGKEVEITGNVVSLSDELLSINRVEVTSPDLLSSRSFVVHGIARAFAMDRDVRVGL